MRAKAGRPDPDREGFSEEIISYDDWLKKKNRIFGLSQKTPLGAQGITAVF